MRDAARIQSFHEFWPYYLGEHGRLANRVMHLAGVMCALACFLRAAWTLDLWWAVGGYFAGFVPGWFGHFFVERNQPASLRYPLWSLIADWRMAFWMVRGRLWKSAPVLEQAGLLDTAVSSVE